MYWKRGLGIGLIFAGFFICLTARVITGAVIGFARENYLGLVGTLVLVTGLALILGTKTLEQRVKRGVEIVSAPEFFKRFQEKETDENKAYLVLDTSAIIRYRPKDLESYLANFKNVLVPDSVLNEIYETASRDNYMEETSDANLPEGEKYRKKLREVIENNSQDIEGFEKYKEIARDYLERSGKFALKKELMPYLTRQKQIASGSEEVKIANLSERLRRIMIAEEKGLDPESINFIPDYAINQIKEYLDEVDIGEGDVDVLATAIYVASYGKHALIGERDIDLREAVELIKAERPKIGRNLDIIEPYKKEYEITDERLRQLRKKEVNKKPKEKVYAA